MLWSLLMIDFDTIRNHDKRREYVWANGNKTDWDKWSMICFEPIGERYLPLSKILSFGYCNKTINPVLLKNRINFLICSRNSKNEFRKCTKINYQRRWFDDY